MSLAVGVLLNIKAKNKMIPTIGDHLISNRGLYCHHGIYSGNGKVIHYSGFSDGTQTGPVEEVSLEHFHKEHDYRVCDHLSREYNGVESIQRARLRIGENLYSLTDNNCEHFVNHCIEGQARSKQVQKALTATATLVTAIGFHTCKILIKTLSKK
jgi:hypothetical protein